FRHVSSFCAHKTGHADGVVALHIRTHEEKAGHRTELESCVPGPVCRWLRKLRLHAPRLGNGVLLFAEEHVAPGGMCGTTRLWLLRASLCASIRPTRLRTVEPVCIQHGQRSHEFGLAPAAPQS